MRDRGSAGRELAIAIVIAILLLALIRGQALAWSDDDYVRSVIVAAANRHGIGSWALVTVAECESELNPYAVGAEGEFGIFQIHPAGLAREYWRRGYTSSWSVWQQADFAASMFAAGHATKWSCYHTEVLGRRPPWWR